jgi:hypothetical protein
MTMLLAAGFDENGIGNMSYSSPGYTQVEYG